MTRIVKVSILFAVLVICGAFLPQVIGFVFGANKPLTAGTGTNSNSNSLSAGTDSINVDVPSNHNLGDEQNNAQDNHQLLTLIENDEGTQAEHSPQLPQEEVLPDNQQSGGEIAEPNTSTDPESHAPISPSGNEQEPPQIDPQTGENENGAQADPESHSLDNGGQENDPALEAQNPSNTGYAEDEALIEARNLFFEKIDAVYLLLNQYKPFYIFEPYQIDGVFNRPLATTTSIELLNTGAQLAEDIIENISNSDFSNFDNPTVETALIASERNNGEDVRTLIRLAETIYQICEIDSKLAD